MSRAPVVLEPTSAERIAAIFAAQAEAQPRVRARNAAERIAVLDRVRAAVGVHMEAVLDALAQDLAKPRDEALQDFGAVLWEIGMIEAGLETWMAPSPVQPQSTQAEASACIVSEPKGRVLLFGPWNFPFALVMQPLVAAVAAGNCVIIKPSEMAPATAQVIEAIVSECFPESEVAVVQGGSDVAENLLDLPFDHVFFTGSTQTGRRVMAAAARHLSSVTLELGGKCPVIVGQGADLAAVVQAVGAGKLFNAGQICLAPDHVWLPPALRDHFVAQLGEQIDAGYYADGGLKTGSIAHIIDDRNLARLRALLDDAVARGAVIVRGGGIKDRVIEPTILVDVPMDAAIMQEEIFGPILPVLTYDHLDQVTSAIARTGKPLAMYVFSSDPEFVDTVLATTSSGGVTVNGVMLHATEPGLPFGGVGGSGMGAYHGAFSFAELSHRRSIYINGPLEPAYCR